MWIGVGIYVMGHARDHCWCGWPSHGWSETVPSVAAVPNAFMSVNGVSAVKHCDSSRDQRSSFAAVTVYASPGDPEQIASSSE